MTERDGTEPRSFADIPELRAGEGCRRCGEPATHTLRLSVHEITAGSGRHGGGRPKVASHGTKLCEPCATQLFVQVRKAMR